MGDIHPPPGGEPGTGQGMGSGDDPFKAEAQVAKDKLGGAVEAVKGEAASFVDSAKESVVEKAEHQKETVTTGLADFAEAIRLAGDQLGEKDQTMAARLVSQAAEGLENLSRSVSEKSPEDMLNSVREFGRANPTAFMAGAVLAGIALGRFVRSSGEHEGAQSEGSATAEMPNQPYDQSHGLSNEPSSIDASEPHRELEGSAFGVTSLGSSELGASVLGEEDETSRTPQGATPLTGYDR